jgi:hypothetical protein
MQGDDRG